MPRILVAECMQEISSFNPHLSRYGDFRILQGAELLQQRGMNTPLGGALAVFEGRDDVELVLTYAARASSGGLLAADDWARLARECVDAIAEQIDGIDAVYFSMHGAMGAEGELDPEGYLLSAVRRLIGERLPMVISLDLHGILTDRMLRQINGVTMFHTYPHVDLGDTGERAARLLLDILDQRPTTKIVRVPIPALVRGDECITKTGCYGDLLRETRHLEHTGVARAAGILIGNPFTDVPELCSQVVVTTDEAKLGEAKAEAMRIAEAFWAQRNLMQAKLIGVDKAIAQARHMAGPVAFTDAADATSSGASGDSNLILAALAAADYPKRVLAPIVDPKAAAEAHRAGVGATIRVTLGGAIDPGRFRPMAVEAKVEALTSGRARLETMRLPLDAGPTAVLTFGNVTVMVISQSTRLFDRSLFYACGLDPRTFDLIVVKSPHTEYHMFDAWVEKNFNIDVAGATSANLPTLGHTVCQRPMFPLDAGVRFEAKAFVY